MDKEQRLMEAFNHLKSTGKIHTQKDAAAEMNATPQNFSAALRGNPSVLTDSFLRRFNQAFGSPFNMDWLLHGEGEMLKDNVTQISHGDNSPNISGNGNNVNAASTIEKALNEIAEQRKLVSKAQDQVSVAQSQVTAAMEQVSKSQQQIDRLLSILETTNNV